MTPKIRILVVDDDEVDCMTAKRTLAGSPLPVKFEVETAGTMAKGVDKLKKRTIRRGAVRFGAAG